MAQVPEGAQMSDDGNYWWDGTQWQTVDQEQSPAADDQAADFQTEAPGASEPQLSEDGNYWWDGSQWQPVEQGQSVEQGQPQDSDSQSESPGTDDQQIIADLTALEDTGVEPGNEAAVTEQTKPYFEGLDSAEEAEAEVTAVLDGSMFDDATREA